LSQSCCSNQLRIQATVDAHAADRVAPKAVRHQHGEVLLPVLLVVPFVEDISRRRSAQAEWEFLASGRNGRIQGRGGRGD